MRRVLQAKPSVLWNTFDDRDRALRRRVRIRPALALTHGSILEQTEDGLLHDPHVVVVELGRRRIVEKAQIPGVRRAVAAEQREQHAGCISEVGPQNSGVRGNHESSPGTGDRGGPFNR